MKGNKQPFWCLESTIPCQLLISSYLYIEDELLNIHSLHVPALSPLGFSTYVILHVLFLFPETLTLLLRLIVIFFFSIYNMFFLFLKFFVRQLWRCGRKKSPVRAGKTSFLLCVGSKPWRRTWLAVRKNFGTIFDTLNTYQKKNMPF